jgi:hypothetical protein
MSDLLAQVRSMLASTPDRWAALGRVDDEVLARRPEPGEWSALQALQHLVDTEAGVFRVRLVAIRDGAESFPGFDPDAEGHVDHPEGTVAELATRLKPMRAESLALLDTLTDADLGKTSRHAELGIVTMAELLNEWAAHDTMHLVQAERAAMQAFIPGSGPWRSYFVDHDAAAGAKQRGPH